MESLPDMNTNWPARQHRIKAFLGSIPQQLRSFFTGYGYRTWLDTLKARSISFIVWLIDLLYVFYK
jgi:hypothetical protein